MRTRHLIPLSLIVATLAIFWQIGNHEFVWSDQNDIVESLSLNRRASSEPTVFRQRAALEISGPLTQAVWAVVADFAASPPGAPRRGLEPRPFHIANLLVHLLSVLLVFALLRFLVPDDWAAGAGALLFALHPLQVEAVAWASGMRQLLCGFFSLASLWHYAHFAAPTAVSAADERAAGGASEKRRIRRKRFHGALALIAFVLALLANPIAVALPLVAWVLDCAFFDRSARQSGLLLISCAALALLFIGVTQWQRLGNQPISLSAIWQRPLIALDALGFYLYKLFLPFQLSVDYGRSPAVAARQGSIYFTWLVPVALGLLLWFWRRRLPHLIAAAAVFAASLLPLLGLIPFRFQSISTVADRFAYLAILGPALGLAWAVGRWKGKPVLVSCGILLAVLGLKSAFQARLWRDNVTLFRYALEGNPGSWISHYHIGVGLARTGAYEEAAQHYRAALKIRPGYNAAQFALGNVLAVQGKLAEAIEQYHKAVGAGYRSADVHTNLGNTFAILNRLTEAIEQYEKSLQINPKNGFAHGSLGHILFRQGKFEEALGHYRKGLEIEPEAADIHYGFANLLATRGEFDQALNHYQTALRINPAYAGACYNVGTILARRGQLEEAIHYFRRALKIRPDFADAHEGLGRALVLQGRTEEGLSHIEQALRILKTARGTETQR